MILRTGYTPYFLRTLKVQSSLCVSVARMEKSSRTTLSEHGWRTIFSRPSFEGLCPFNESPFLIQISGAGVGLGQNGELAGRS